jgi:hypothetical protein
MLSIHFKESLKKLRQNVDSIQEISSVYRDSFENIAINLADNHEDDETPIIY